MNDASNISDEYDLTRVSVLALIQLPPPAHGLSLKNSRMLEGGLARTCELRVVRLGFARTLDEIGSVTVRKGLLASWYLIKVVFELLYHRPDMVYITVANQGYSLVRDCLYMRIAKFFGTPVVAHLPSRGLGKFFMKAARPVQWLLSEGFQACDVIIGLNKGNYEDLMPLGIDRKKFEVVQNGLPETSVVREPRIWANPSEVRLLFLSNLSEEKGLLVFIRALAMLRKSGRSVVATVAGPWHGKGARKKAFDLLEDSPLSEQIHWVGGVFGAEKERLYADHDIFVFPSHYQQENCPNVVIEAMRHGLAVVTTHHAGIPEIVRDGIDGVLIPPRNPRALADALVSLVDDPSLANRLAASARRRYTESFTQQRWDEEVFDVFRRVASRS